jgi:hypothetical protein
MRVCQWDMVHCPFVRNRRHRGVGPLMPRSIHLHDGRVLSLRDDPSEETGRVGVTTLFVPQRHVPKKDPRDNEGTTIRLWVTSFQPGTQRGSPWGRGNNPFPRKQSPQVFLIDEEKSQMRRSEKTRFRSHWRAVRRSSPHRIRTAAAVASHDSTTQKLPG